MQDLYDRQQLGVDVRSDIASAAAEALVAGLDSPALRVVAGLGASDAPEVWERWWSQVAADLDLVKRDGADAVLAIATRIAAAMRERRLAPQEGATQIWNVTLLVDGHPPEILHPFIYIASEWELRSEHERQVLAQGLRAAADALAD